MNNDSETLLTGDQQPSIFDDPYQKEVLLHQWQTERKGTLQSILIIIGIVLFSDLFALAKADQFNTENIMAVLLFPLIFTGLYFYARSQPYAAMLAIIIIFSLAALYTILESGGTYLVSGLIAKALLVYAFIKGYRHAKEARQAKRELELLV